jgi:hypothetical protein
MPNYVILDTSIYRELGLRFQENIDYVNLCGFTIATDSEVLMSTIVKEEFYNFYKTHLLKKYQEYSTAVSSLQRDPHFLQSQIIFTDIDKTIQDSLKAFYKLIDNIPQHNSPFSTLKHTLIDGLTLTKFILESRNQGSTNVQVRDYLIWDSVLGIALEESTDRIEIFGKSKIVYEKGIIYFITKDKIFQEDELFQSRLKELNISNVEIFNSIPEFLHKKGFNLPFLNRKLILSKITDSKILKDLSKDIGSLLSYVSPDYDSAECDKRKVESQEVEASEVIEFYSYQDLTDKRYKFVAHIKVLVKVVFEADEKPIEKVVKSNSRYLETYDKQGRPIYNASILFIYRGLLNTTTKTIKSIQFVDYLPWVYI